MARGLNKVQIIGHLGADPDTRYMPSGKAVTNARIATSEQWKDKESGDPMEKTEWHSVVFFGKLAEIAAEYIRKGQQVYVEGKLQTRKWEDKEGKDRYTTEIIADQLLMLGKGGGSGDEREEREERQERRPAAKSGGKPAAKGGSKRQDPVDDDGDFDDDIPF